MIYFLLLLFVVALWILKENKLLSRATSERKYCYAIIGVVVLLAALRGTRIGGLGADDISFIDDYNNIGSFTFAQIYDRWQDYFGYYAISKCFYHLGFSARVWFAVLELFYMFSIYRLIERYSKDKILSLLVFICIGLMCSSFTHLKQILSASFVILSFLSFTEKKYIRTILFMAVAFITHTASLIALLLFIMYFLRNIKYYIVLVLGVVVVLYTQRELLLINAVSFIQKEQFEHFEMYLDLDSTYSYVTFIYYIVLLLTCLIVVKSYNNCNRGESKFLIGACIVACSCQLFAAFNPSLFRLANYFTPFFMLLIPNVVSSYPDGKRRIYSVVFICMMSFFMLYTIRNDPYVFMWESKMIK